jgi:capsular exopolysaccharide synthesis family protein
MKDLPINLPPDTGSHSLGPAVNGQVPAASKFRLQKVLFFLRKFWWIPLVTAALGGCIALVVFLNTPPNFVSYGTLIETDRLRLPDGAAFTSDRDNFIGTLTEFLRGRRMRYMTTNFMATYPKLTFPSDDHKILPVDIQVYASPKSLIYTIEARSSNPGFTPAYLNVLMDQYISYRSSTRGNVTAKTLENITASMLEFEGKRDAAKTNLDYYEESNHIAVLREESAVDANHLATLRTELSDYQLQTNLLAARELEMDSDSTVATNASDAIFDSLRSSSGSTSGATGRQEAARQLELLKMDRERLGKYLRPEHPKMVKLDQDIAHAQKLIEVYRQQNHEQIAAARQALQIKIENVEKFITDWDAKVKDENDRLKKAEDLKHDVDTQEKMFDRLTALMDTVRVSEHIDTDTLDILDRASPATRSYSEALRMGGQYTILGLCLGLGVVCLLAMRDDRFDSLAEVTETFGDSVVGQVPEVPGVSDKKPLALLECNDERHMYAESYRSLRSALLFLGVDGQRPKTLLITSAVPDEGKSTVVTNLARMLALGGSKVLLIDGDLRKGHIHDALKLQSKPGLSELLRQNGDPEKFIQATDIPEFAFLSRGTMTRNPGDLFLSPAFDELLVRLREQYDYVLIDSSPVFAADDTATMAPKADGTLFVVRSRFSHARIVREALELLFQRQTRVLGLILNRSDSNARSYYYYKYGEYDSAGKTIDAESSS